MTTIYKGAPRRRDGTKSREKERDTSYYDIIDTAENVLPCTSRIHQECNSCKILGTTGQAQLKQQRYPLHGIPPFPPTSLLCRNKSAVSVPLALANTWYRTWRGGVLNQNMCVFSDPSTSRKPATSHGRHRGLLCTPCCTRLNKAFSLIKRNHRNYTMLVPRQGVFLF